MSDEQPKDNNSTELEAAVAQANQLANMILLALRTVHEYIVPRALQHGIKLSAREQHAWSVSLSIAMSQAKAQYRMPSTRLQKRPASVKASPASVEKASPKTELFPRTEPPDERFSNPAVAPALRKLRQMLAHDRVSEEELMAILKESAPRQTLFISSLSEIPVRTAELCLERWPTIVELVQASRDEDPEAA